MAARSDRVAQSWRRGLREWTPTARWNFMAFGSDIAFFTFGVNLSSAFVIFPLFVHHLTPDNSIVALVAALRAAGQYVPQLLVASRVERRRHALPLLLKVTILERVPYLVMAGGAILLASRNSTALLVVFLSMVLLATLGSGLSFPPWLDMLARSMPQGWLGRFLGFWSGVGGIMGIGGAALAAYILATIPWPYNFAACFALTFLAMVISFVLLALGREPARELAPHVTPSAAETTSAAPHSVATQLRAIWQVLREDGGLRRLIAVNALATFATMGSALYAVASLKLGGLTNAQAGAETTILVIASTAGNFLWGALGDRWGHKAVLVCGALAGGASALVALVAHGVVAYGVVFLLIGLSLAANFLAGLTFIAEFAPNAKRPTYSALAAVAVAPFAIIAPLFAGWVADLWGYLPVFWIAAVAGVVAAVAYQFWAPNPPPHDLVAHASDRMHVEVAD